MLVNHRSKPPDHDENVSAYFLQRKIQSTGFVDYIRQI